MKAFRIILLAGLAVMVANGAVRAQRADSCLINLHPDDTSAIGWKNPDSMLYDTCIGSVPLGGLYARGGFVITYKYDVFHIPATSIDTTIEVLWQDIDTIYTTIRKQFDTLYQRYGAFVLRKMNPQNTDSSSYEARTYNLIFTHYTYAKPVVTYMDSVDIIGFIFRKPQRQVPSKVNPTTDEKDFSVSEIQNDNIQIQFYKQPLKGNVSVVDINGKTISQVAVTGEHLNLSLKGIPIGVYFIIYNFHTAKLNIIK